MGDHVMTGQSPADSADEDMFPGADVADANTSATRSPTQGSKLSSGGARAAPSGATGASKASPKVHKPTGYVWEKDEDAPGWAWKNKKAQDEYARAMESIIEKDKIVGRKYGDIGLEEAEAERLQ